MEIQVQHPPGEFVEIPLIDLGDGGPVALFEAFPDRAEALIEAGRQLIPQPAFGILESLSRRWARRTRNPYFDEIEAIAARLPIGGWFLNLCFEWGCTTGVMADPAAGGTRILRTLDWPFHGLGRKVVVARQDAPAGEFYNVTWPAFVGVATAMAPGRFAVALNQAPLVRRGWWPLALDWTINRLKVYWRRALPPAHLLRQVVETCTDYERAKDMLVETPIALPAMFTLSGAEYGQGCVIERLERRAYVHEAPAAIANHWLTAGLEGDPRGIDSHRRLRLMSGFCAGHVQDFDWLVAPITNQDTRLATVMNAARGTLRLQGWEASGPVTEIFDLAAAEAARRGGAKT
ncbi:MAG: hypothetical protein QF654_02795 [Alphaproteobacteria bacterium]|mgnify:CR=1 FL=1|jgi:hypothetical protein|nr:hypothetical protein [Alphaproteobacteria bacterium]